jgi:hypothetical protein
MADIKAVKDMKAGDGRSAPGRSGVASPYFDLDASLAVAHAIQQQGGGTASPDQLAHWLGYKSTGSGTYVTRVSAASKHFGLVDNSGDRLALTERAKTILSPVMPEDAVNAKVDAFLSVQLFSKIYEQYRGTQLPPEMGLKNLLLSTYKVLPDRVGQALRVFLNSAEQAGFFSTTGDRSKLIKPAIAQTSTSVASTTKPDGMPPPTVDAIVHEKQRTIGGGDGGAGGVDTAIIGLLRKLPMQGASWTAAEQTRFLTAFTHTIQFLYPTEDGEK